VLFNLTMAFFIVWVMKEAA